MYTVIPNYTPNDEKKDEISCNGSFGVNKLRIRNLTNKNEDELRLEYQNAMRGLFIQLRNLLENAKIPSWKTIQFHQIFNRSTGCIGNLVKRANEAQEVKRANEAQEQTPKPSLETLLADRIQLFQAAYRELKRQDSISPADALFMAKLLLSEDDINEKLKAHERLNAQFSSSAMFTAPNSAPLPVADDKSNTHPKQAKKGDMLNAYFFKPLVVPSSVAPAIILAVAATDAALEVAVLGSSTTTLKLSLAFSAAFCSAAGLALVNFIAVTALCKAGYCKSAALSGSLNTAGFAILLFAGANAWNPLGWTCVIAATLMILGAGTHALLAKSKTQAAPSETVREDNESKAQPTFSR